nr:hypothetical protein [Tanacetum cinerariifolium]
MLFVNKFHVGGVGHDVNVRSLIDEGAHVLEVPYAASREFLEKPEHFNHPVIDLFALLENEGKVLNDFRRFFGIVIAEFAVGGAVNLALKMKGDMIIENLDLKPTIDAMMRDFLDVSRYGVRDVPHKPSKWIRAWEDALSVTFKNEREGTYVLPLQVVVSMDWNTMHRAPIHVKPFEGYRTVGPNGIEMIQLDGA